MLPRPTPRPHRPRIPRRRHRLVRQPPLALLRQLPAAGVAAGGPTRQRLHAHRRQRLGHVLPHRPRRGDVPGLDLLQQRRQVVALHRRAAAQQVVQRRPEAVDVAPRADLLQPPGRLLRRHVGRRADGLAGLRLDGAAAAAEVQRRLAGLDLRLAGHLRQAPVHDQRLPVLAEHHVAGLQVAVQHAAAVGVGDRLADVHEAAQQLAEGDRVEAPAAGVEGVRGVLEGVAPDEPHGVIRPAALVAAEAVDRHDAGVLQAAGDLGLQEEAAAGGRVVREAALDLLERDAAVQFEVLGDADLPEAALRVRLEDAVAGGPGRQLDLHAGPGRHVRGIRIRPPRGRRNAGGGGGRVGGRERGGRLRRRQRALDLGVADITKFVRQAPQGAQ